MDISHESLHGQDITILGPYRPWRYHKEQGGDGSNYPSHSGRILDLKDGKAEGIDYFCTFISPRIARYSLVAAVPSHDPAKTASGIRSLAAKLEAAVNCKNVSELVVRHTKIQKLADGGNRSVDVHLGSIAIENAEPIVGQAILLLDDVMTTGNSLLACRKLLLDAGADLVKCVALGRTTY
jgi:hypothetical protein